MTLSSRSFQGVNLLDFNLETELTQPWTCVYNFYQKCHILGWEKIRIWGLLRFISCLAISICVLLLAPAINTIGIPKERWYPNIGQGWGMTEKAKRALTITAPRMTIYGFDWMNFWTQGWNMVGQGPDSYDAALAIAAASTYTLLSGLPNVYSSQSTGPGWMEIPNEIDDSITGINTVINESTVQTISVQNSRIQDIFNYLKMHGSESYYRDSSGWNGYINMTLPMLTTSCVSGLAMNSTTPIGTIPVSSTFVLIFIELLYNLFQ